MQISYEGGELVWGLITEGKDESIIPPAGRGSSFVRNTRHGRCFDGILWMSS
jgi:hypothetical protein